MIFKTKVAVLINGKFFPNEMQIAFSEGLPFIESPFLNSIASKVLQIKLKVVFKTLGLKFPKRKIFITFKDPNLIPADFSYLEIPLVYTVFCYLKLIPIPLEAYFWGSLDLTGKFYKNHFVEFKIQDFLQEFVSDRKLFMPISDISINPQVFLDKSNFKEHNFIFAENIFLPRILVIALNLQKYLKFNILLVSSSADMQDLISKIKSIKKMISLCPENYNLLNVYANEILIDLIHDSNKSQLKILKDYDFKNSIGIIKPCPCGKLLTTEKCSCGVNYTKTFYKNFSPRFFAKFSCVIYLDRQLLEDVFYRFTWFSTPNQFELNSNASLKQNTLHFLKIWGQSDFIPVFEKSDAKLLLSSFDQISV